MYKCLECGHIFDEGEQAVWKEPRGEYCGSPCYEEVVGCPVCRGCYEETHRCVICGSEHILDELADGEVCDDCLDDCKYDFERCYEISKNDVEKVEINSLLATVFDAGDIEQILLEHIKRNKLRIDCSEYIDKDRYWFAQELGKEVKGE